MSRIAVRIVSRAPCIALLALAACGGTGPARVARHSTDWLGLTRASRSVPRAGIAIVGSGGAAGLQRSMVLDSATAHFMTVTRASCNDRCAPLDSASGTLAIDDVAHIYAVVAREQVFALRESYAICDGCADQALVTTAVFGNRQRKVITSDSHATPEVLGRVHIAVAEAIRSARGDR